MKYFTIYTLFFVLIVSSCSNKKFDKNEWNYRTSDVSYPHRESMLEDLIENHKLKGKNLNELRELFGFIDIECYPDEYCCVRFDITTEFGFADVDPVYTKDLVLILDKDSIVNNIKIIEGKN